MDFKFIPGDIPLPLPTGGLEFLHYIFHGLLVVSWVVHILFINVLLGASLASVYFNKRGARENNPILDRVAYLLTTPVTISENMGALWGVAPLLLISVLYTPLFYSASLMNSPQWLHIIYGNIVAFLCSYLYKYSWNTLRENKGLHITIGTMSVLLFYTLPPVFMATVQLYITPSTWNHGQNFWDALFRADTLFRLAHFYLASFAVSGVFMLLYGYFKRKSSDATDQAAGAILIRTGKAWFIVPTVLNFFIGPLALFHFPNYGLEAFFNHGYHWGILLTVLLALYAIHILVKEFKNDDIPPTKVWKVVIIMVVAIVTMASIRHGMRVALVSPVMAASVAKSEAFQKEAKEAYEAAKQSHLPSTTGPRGRILAEQHGCLGCHGERERVIGPSYAEIAKRAYTPEKILALVRQPVPSNWPEYAQAPMPPMATVPEAELREIANWINGIK
ncbi:MAG: cytochrome C [Magnetococcales bacterium]|nr:cytochrome C [Magnetococcales bacterium]MBF0114249.1 cytochrome C [Magnetococcales bacterium]